MATLSLENSVIKRPLGAMPLHGESLRDCLLDPAACSDGDVNALAVLANTYPSRIVLHVSYKKCGCAQHIRASSLLLLEDLEWYPQTLYHTFHELQKNRVELWEW